MTWQAISAMPYRGAGVVAAGLDAEHQRVRAEVGIEERRQRRAAEAEAAAQVSVRHQPVRAIVIVIDALPPVLRETTPATAPAAAAAADATATEP